MSKRTRFLQFSPPRVLERPPGSTPADLVQALAAAVISGHLPSGWNVEQGWRNSPTAPFKYDDIESMVGKSANRGGDFNSLYFNRYLRKRANLYGVQLRAPREATEQEEFDFEEEAEEIRERESGEFEQLAKKQKRVAAAKRGAATRKAAQAARKAAQAELARKRSAAAKKGWETRRKNAAAKKAKAKTKRGKSR